ncbi:MAG TPA: hypothetical protein VHT24_15110 [Pseudacidobacterium sp.]|jgi:hypothetical protein|nr:hypothetical protein [Pseudacidobacterium sp.]
MNGILDSQTSGNDWDAPIQAMLHERIQEVPAVMPIRHQQSFINDIEAQMQQFERDYRDALTGVRKLYVFPSDTSVAEFLNDHRAVPQLLIDAAPWLKKYFGNTVFSLRVTSDEYGWQNLYADAMWSGDARDALQLLDQFEDEWWIANCRPARGALTFTYRLV